MPPEKAQKVQEKIQTIEDVYKKTAVPVQEKANSKKYTSPVEISTMPEESSAPKGYKETLWKVVSGTYFRDALWKFPIIIDTSRVEPR